MRRLVMILLCWLCVAEARAANIYVRSTDGSDSDNGSTWALAKATLAGAAAIDAAGDTIYVSDNHAESTAAAVTLNWAGTAASPVRILCVDDSAEPPTALATTGTVATTGVNSHLGVHHAGNVYIYGLTFTAGSGANAAQLNLNTGGSAGESFYEECNFVLGNTSASSYIQVGSGSSRPRTTWKNCTVTFGATGQSINCWIAALLWQGGSLVAGTIPTTLFTTVYVNDVRVVGVDLSAAGSGKSLVGLADSSWGNNYEFRNCKLGSSVSLGSGTQGFQSVYRLINCDSGDTNTRYQLARYEGSVFSETTIVRTGGATDGTTAVSRKMVSSANSKFFRPLVSDPIYAWNETTGSNVTVTVETVTDNVTLTDAEAWVEVEYLGTSGFPLASTSTDRAADILATPANQTTSTETWTTTGLTTPVKQKLAVTFTPQEKGMLVVRVCLAKASTTMYFCPKVIDNADGKELMVMSPAYLNQYDVADPPPAASGNFLPLLSLAPERTWEGVDRNPRYSPFAILGALGP